MKTWNEIMNKMKSGEMVMRVTGGALGATLGGAGLVAKAFCPEYLIVWEGILLLLLLYLCFCIVGIGIVFLLNLIVRLPWLLGDIAVEIKNIIGDILSELNKKLVDFYKKTWEG
jgi:hypothetical protein